MGLVSDDLPKDLGRRIGNISELPEELRSQLQAAKTSEFERNVIAVLDDQYGGIANVDEIMVGMYRLTGEIHQRQQLSNRLYRMGVSGLLESVPRKKGVYRTKHP